MSNLRTRRLGYALGAEITGIDFSRPLPDDAVAEMRRAWLEHILLCIPGFDGPPAELAAFCGRFGEIDDNRANPKLRHPDDPLVSVIANKVVTSGARLAYGSNADAWHFDRSYTDHPASATFLLARQLPDAGGDTLFSNTYMAYETLSPAMQQLLDPLEAVYDFTFSDHYGRLSPEERSEWRLINPPTVHKLVRTHPETGRKALYLDARVVRNFVGMTEEESRPMLDMLMQHATRYEFVYRHRWTVGDLVMWDNRCAMHYAVPDFDPSQVRLMHRLTLLTPKSGYFLGELAAAGRG